MKYMIMMFGSAAEMMETQSPDWIREMIAFMQNLDVELRNAGELVFNAGLADGSTAKTVSLVDGLPVTTDGPFVEAKEHLGGFYIIEAADLDAALGWASKVTRTVSTPIEVWPFADSSGG